MYTYTYFITVLDFILLNQDGVGRGASPSEGDDGGGGGGGGGGGDQRSQRRQYYSARLPLPDQDQHTGFWKI